MAKQSKSRTAHARRRKLALEGLEDRHLLAGVITIGDSWAALVAAGAPRFSTPAIGGSNPLGTVMSTFQPGVPVYNESFGGGTAAQMVTDLYTPTGVIARVNAHPDADVVWLSAGGNDLLAGQAAGGFYVGNPNNAAVFAAVQANVQTITDAILAVRPDIQVVIMGYDYINMWDMVSGDAGTVFRFNLGVIKSGNTGVDALQNLSLNDGFKTAEAGKVAIASASRRVAHVYNFGLENTYGGYNGYFGNFPAAGSYPPELYPHLPTPASRMSDAIHLNDLGYTTLSLHAEQDFLLSAFSSATLGLNTSSLAFGDQRIGTLSSQNVTASNTGANFTKVKDLNFSAANGAFSGGGLGFNPLFKDPTLASDTATVNYAFAPTAHGLANQAVGVSSNAGSPSLSLSGRGVGPTYSGPASLGFVTVPQGDTPTLNFDVDNITSDVALASLTNLTLKSLSFSGPDAARFSLPGFAPDTVVGAGGSAALQLAFDAVGADPGSYSATLTFTTDQNAAFGASGQQFSITLSAEVEAAEPTFSSNVTGRRVFYGNSFYENDLGSRASAIATDKVAYIPNGTNSAGINNVTSYSKGLNGIMVELTGTHGTLTAADFTVQMSPQFENANDTPPSTWAAAPAFTVSTVNLGGGVTRYELVWADNVAPKNRYVSVIAEGNDTKGGNNTNTGLAASDQFFFGNLVGESFNTVLADGYFATEPSDEIAARFNQGTGTDLSFITNRYDYNRDFSVDPSDQIVARFNQGFLVRFSTTNPPAAPEDGDGNAVASALAASSGGSSGGAAAPVAALLPDDAEEAAVASAVASITAADGPDAAADDADDAVELGDVYLSDDLLDALLG